MILKGSTTLILLIIGPLLTDINCSEKFYNSNVLSLPNKNELLKVIFDDIFSHENLKEKVEGIFKAITKKDEKLDLKSEFEEIFKSFDYNGIFMFEKDFFALSINLKVLNSDSKEIVELRFKIKFDSKLFQMEYEEGSPNKLKVTMSLKDLLITCNGSNLVNFLIKQFLEHYYEDVKETAESMKLLLKMDPDAPKEIEGMEDEIIEKLMSGPDYEKLIDKSDLQKIMDEKIKKLNNEDIIKFETSFDSLPSNSKKDVPTKFEIYLNVKDEKEVKINKIFESKDLLVLRKRLEHENMEEESKSSKTIKNQKIAIIILAIIIVLILIISIVGFIMMGKQKI